MPCLIVFVVVFVLSLKIINFGLSFSLVLALCYPLHFVDWSGVIENFVPVQCAQGKSI